MRPPRGTVLLVVLMLMYLAGIGGRTIFRENDHPAVVVFEPPGIRVLLGEGFAKPGIHQFSDGIDLRSVIELTVAEGVSIETLGRLPEAPLADGESLALFIKDSEFIELRRGWMPAAQRMVLGIPLHPERMSLSDWQALPGIGPRLAQKIEENRQKNGDFGGLDELDRVDGIGQGLIERWRRFFE